MRCGGCASACERSGQSPDKLHPVTAVRYGNLRYVGEFTHSPETKLGCGAMLVISTERGIEIGQQLPLTCFGCEKAVSAEDMHKYAVASGGDVYRTRAGRILRQATAADLGEWKHIQASGFEKLQTCRQFARELGLDMKIVDCEHTFGGERVVFYFMAEERIDFRELVHGLASEFQTRIEMRQVGARDEARLVADFETCGRECCCRNFLKTLKPVSMQMAKVQKTTLDLSKVSGRCGRLKCCLRYEHETYEELDKKLPKMNLWVRTAAGVGQIVERQVLTQLLRLRQVDGRMLVVPTEEILELNVPPPPPPGNGNGAEEGESRGRGKWQRGRPPQQARPQPGGDPRQNDSTETPAPAEPDSAGAAPEGPVGVEGPAESGPDTAGDGPRRRKRGRRRRRGRRGGGASPPGGPEASS